LVADAGIHSLLDFKYSPKLFARNGEAGRGKNQGGEFGADAVARVPIGTQVFDEGTGELLADLTHHGERVVVCKGGSGGFGNSRFATPSRQAPEFAKPGTAGEERRLRLELKLMADVGLLGFPNAGKSTFLSRVSAARPKIAAYPFTTLVPQLGVVRPYADDPSGTFVMADIPGLIEGASEGAGLGIRFLKHLERVRVLCHLIEVPLEAVSEAEFDDVSPHMTRGPIDLVARYQALRAELATFSTELAAVPEVVVVNKADLLPGADQHPQSKKLRRHLAERGIALLFMSGASGAGLDTVVRELAARVKLARAGVSERETPSSVSVFARARVAAVEPPG
jgi:GTP-binding protein